MIGAAATPATSVEASTPPARPSRRRLVIISLVLFGLVVGFGAAAFAFRPGSAPSAFSGAPSVSELDFPATPSVAPSTASVPQPTVADEPISARDALQRYLEAEIAENHDVGFGLVDAETQVSDGPLAAWQNGRVNRLLPERFSILSETVVASGVDFTVSATRTPAVSPLTGLVPARSEETWRVVNAGGWRVLRGRPIDVRPELPSDVVAAATGSAWLARAAACDESGATALQLSANLLGSPDLRDGTCKSDSAWTAGDAIPLSHISNPTVFVAAYGSSVGRWARAVPVTGPGRYTIVLVPLGNEWRVTGVIPEGSPRP